MGGILPLFELEGLGLVCGRHRSSRRGQVLVECCTGLYEITWVVMASRTVGVPREGTDVIEREQLPLLEFLDEQEAAIPAQ